MGYQISSSIVKMILFSIILFLMFCNNQIAEGYQSDYSDYLLNPEISEIIGTDSYNVVAEQSDQNNDFSQLNLLNIHNASFSNRFSLGDYVMTTDYLNLRSAPGLSSTVIKTFPTQTVGAITMWDDSGYNVQDLLGVYVDGYYWWHVWITMKMYQPETYSGWFSEHRLEDFYSWTYSAGDWVKSTTDGLRLRSGPGQDTTALRWLEKGAVAQVIDHPENGVVGGWPEYTWWYVELAEDGQRGWLAEPYLETTTKPVISVPDAPRLVRPAHEATGVSTRPTFEWRGVDNADSYSLLLVGSSFDDDEYILLETSNTSLVLPSRYELNKGEAHAWTVFASNEAGNSKNNVTRAFVTEEEPDSPDDWDDSNDYEKPDDWDDSDDYDDSYEWEDPEDYDDPYDWDDPAYDANAFGIGLFDPADGVFHLDDDNRSFRYGPRNSNWHVICGDWNGNGTFNTGLYDPIDGVFHYQGITFRYGPRNSNWLPIAGDWNGNDSFNVGLYDPVDGVFHLSGEIPLRFGPKNSDWLPISGDWNRNGTWDVGLYDPVDGVFHLQDITFRYGPRNSSWLPLAGDWNGDRSFSVGLYDQREGVFHLSGEPPFRYGPKNRSWKPVSGLW